MVGKKTVRIEISVSLKFRGSGKEVVATVISRQEDWCSFPMARGRGLSSRSTWSLGGRGAGDTATQETELLNRTSNTWDEGW